MVYFLLHILVSYNFLLNIGARVHVFRYRHEDDVLQGATLKGYTWSLLPVGNDVQPSYLRQIYEDVPRSWTLMQAEKADHQKFNETLLWGLSILVAP